MDGMFYEELPIKNLIPVKSGGKVKQMTKSTTNEAPKASKKYQKTRGEHAKDILIAILVTAAIAFIGGMQFANKQNAKVEQAVKSAQTVVAPVATTEGK